MRRVKTEIILIGSGTATMLAASRLHQLGHDFVIFNPGKNNSFIADDLMPRHGMGIWNSAYRNTKLRKNISIPHLYDEVKDRLSEIFPGSTERSGLVKGECLSVLSSTPIHREKTEALEREFFKLEKKPFSSGHFRLMNRENIESSTRRFGLDFSEVTQLEGGVHRNYALYWNAEALAYEMNLFLRHKFLDRIYSGYELKKIHGKGLEITDRDDQTVILEAQKAVLVLFTGDILPALKDVTAACEQPWIQGVRRKRRERHHAWFEKGMCLGRRVPPDLTDGLWIELGSTHYLFNEKSVYACWSVRSGPDMIEKVVDETMRSVLDARYVKAERSFWLEWEWPTPQWRKTSHDTWWATAFEGDLTATFEILWNLPI